MGVVGAPQVTPQPFSSIFLCSPLPAGMWQTPGLCIPWCLPTSFSICLVFFPLSLCLARWFWPDLVNRRHVHTTSVCVSSWWTGGLCVVWLHAGSWHRLPCWYQGLCMRCVVSCSSTSFPRAFNAHDFYASSQFVSANIALIWAPERRRKWEWPRTTLQHDEGKGADGWVKLGKAREVQDRAAQPLCSYKPAIQHERWASEWNSFNTYQDNLSAAGASYSWLDAHYSVASATLCFCHLKLE